LPVISTRSVTVDPKDDVAPIVAGPLILPGSSSGGKKKGHHMSRYRRPVPARWYLDLRWHVLNDRAGAICERCHKETPIQVHHLRYPKSAASCRPSALVGQNELIA